MTRRGWTPDPVVSGFVRDSEGQPVPGADVFISESFRRGASDDPEETMEYARGGPRGPESPSAAEAPVTAHTDASGRYAFRAGGALRKSLAPRRIHVWATSGDRISSKVLVDTRSRPVQVVDLVLTAALRPVIRLLTRDGQPVVDAHVELHCKVEASGQDPRPQPDDRLGARTDAAGIARLPPIPDRPDWKMSLDVNPRHMPRHHVRRLEVRRLRRDEPLEIRIRRGCTIRGRVEFADGSPGARAHVSSGRENCDPLPNWGHGTDVAEDGSFLLRGVATRLTVIVLRTPTPSRTPGSTPVAGRTGPAAQLTLRPRCKEGADIDLGTVRFELGTISGIVLGPDGVPVPGGYVRLDEVGAPHPIGHDGRFAIRGVEAGPHELRARIHAPSAPFTGRLVGPSVQVESGASDVVLHVTGAGNLIVRFHPPGRPDQPLEVRNPRLFGDRVAATWEGTHAEIRATAPPGWCRGLRVEADGHRTAWPSDVEMLADRATVVDVTLEPSG